MASTPVVPSAATTVSGADSRSEISGTEVAADSTLLVGAVSDLVSDSEVADSVAGESASDSVSSTPTGAAALSTFKLNPPSLASSSPSASPISRSSTSSS